MTWKPTRIAQLSYVASLHSNQLHFKQYKTNEIGNENGWQIKLQLQNPRGGESTALHVKHVDFDTVHQRACQKFIHPYVCIIMIAILLE